MSILQFYDPCLRIKTFIELLDNNFYSDGVSVTSVDLMNLSFKSQSPSEGLMCFFMHNDLRNFFIDKIKEVA